MLQRFSENNKMNLIEGYNFIPSIKKLKEIIEYGTNNVLLLINK